LKVFIDVSFLCIWVSTLREVKVLEGYRVTIPKEIRERLRIRLGDTLRLEVKGGRIILHSERIPLSPTLKMLGLAVGHGESLEEALVGEVEEKLAREKVR